MDHFSLGANFKGIAMSGAWGCFDEINRVSVDVLSVVSTQLRILFNALRAKASSCVYDGESIKINEGFGLFITLNPGFDSF